MERRAFARFAKTRVNALMAASRNDDCGEFFSDLLGRVSKPAALIHINAGLRWTAIIFKTLNM